MYGIEIRLFDLEMMELDSYGLIYDKWDEKHTELQYIYDDMEFMKEFDKLKEDIKKFKNDIENYQVEYGGLARISFIYKRKDYQI